jgi:hypothetical protein
MQSQKIFVQGSQALEKERKRQLATVPELQRPLRCTYETIKIAAHTRTRYFQLIEMIIKKAEAE